MLYFVLFLVRYLPFWAVPGALLFFDLGVYYYNATATDYANNVNTTVTRKVTIDLTSPSLANLSDNGADLNNSFVSRSFVLLNGTGTDAINISNVTIFRQMRAVW